MFASRNMSTSTNENTSVPADSTHNSTSVSSDDNDDFIVVKAAPMKKATKSGELGFAFVNAKVSKRAAAKAAAKGLAIKEAKDVDIREWDILLRKALKVDTKVTIYVGNQAVTETTKAILKATSVTFHKLYNDDKVVLPKDTDKDGVVRLIDYPEYIVDTSQRLPSPMRVPSDIFEALSNCAVAKALGMEKYTGHTYKVCERSLRTRPPSYESLDAIIAVKDKHVRLFNIVVQGLATQVREDTIPDPEDFTMYLANHPALDKAINKVNERYADSQARSEEKKAAYLERKAKQEEGRVQREKACADHDDRDAKANTLRTACKKAVRQKSNCSVEKRKKFTPEERRHWVNTRGGHLPKVC